MSQEPISAEGQPRDENSEALGQHPGPSSQPGSDDAGSDAVSPAAGESENEGLAGLSRSTSDDADDSDATETPDRDEALAAEAPTEDDSVGSGVAPQPAELSEEVIEEVEEDVEDEEEEDEEDEEEDEGPLEEVEPLEECLPDEEESSRREWYILKVQSNREQSICDGLRRRVAVAGLDDYFGEVIVPTEDVAEFKNGKRRVVKRKLYPGYIVINMAINDETWFLVRETPGIGDFTGSAGRPTPMLPHEVDRIVKSGRTEEEGGQPIKTAIPFKAGDRVRIKDGTFENFEGDVEGIDEANGRVTVMINIFGRSTPVELEHWQIDAV